MRIEINANAFHYNDQLNNMTKIVDGKITTINGHGFRFGDDATTINVYAMNDKPFEIVIDGESIFAETIKFVEQKAKSLIVRIGDVDFHFEGNEDAIKLIGELMLKMINDCYRGVWQLDNLTKFEIANEQ